MPTSWNLTASYPQYPEIRTQFLPLGRQCETSHSTVLIHIFMNPCQHEANIDLYDSISGMTLGNRA
jgi:hypothetical protein